MKQFIARSFVIIFSPLLAHSLWGAAGGSLSGKVTDPGGRTVPNATVTATNIDTNFKHTSTTDSKGIYSLPDLAVGRYSLRLEALGFRPYRSTGVVVDANSALRVDVSLVIGEIDQPFVADWSPIS